MLMALDEALLVTALAIATGTAIWMSILSGWAAVERNRAITAEQEAAAIADFLVRWAVRDRRDRILEPSCGDGQILEPAAAKLRQLGARPARVVGRISAVEFDGTDAGIAARRMSAAAGAPSAVHVGDFFAWSLANPRRRFDVVVGNPPFIRYQSFPEVLRTRARRLMEEISRRYWKKVRDRQE